MINSHKKFHTTLVVSVVNRSEFKALKYVTGSKGYNFSVYFAHSCIKIVLGCLCFLSGAYPRAVLFSRDVCELQ